MNIEVFRNFKNNVEVKNLDESYLANLSTIIDVNIKKQRKSLIKPNNNILKNKKIQNKKCNIMNKINLILNKLSESNIDALVIEFIDNIGQIDINEYNELLKAFYLKMISEINFIKTYIEFFRIITGLYQQVQQYNISYFISIVETKFKLDYCNKSNEDSLFDFINSLDETKTDSNRINNIILIKNLVEYKILSEKIYEYCDNIIINQSFHLADIYNWFNIRNKKLNQSEINIIKKHLLKPNLESRKYNIIEII
jgi:hypothetical protein